MQQNLVIKIIYRIQSGATRLRWWLFLYPRVKGRIKLRGNLKGLNVSRSFKCDGDLWLGIYSEHGTITIGENVSASGPLVITAIEHVTLGHDVLMGPNVMLTDHYHGDPKDPSIWDIPPSHRALHSRGPIVVEDFVQLGANTSVLSPAVIGRAAIIGANSVVFGSLAERTAHAGAPTRPIHPNLDFEREWP